MSRLAQDSFISDDEEEVCPLCVEEFDISDKGFKPCPCGYQVCQFCFNNIRQNPQLNGRCPGCRRPYDDESVEYKVVTAEEWRQDHQKQTRREKEKKQKERERKEIEQASRKHLSGMRVIQKNLVYVVGLNPHIPHEELHNTLRGDQFFGQYGKIQKIVVNRRNNGGAGNGGIGVYVTYLKKEDAAKCIAAVDGSMNDGKILRAAYGTTKYCSSYLRNQPCPNPNCMFLHEPGEEADSYTRQDLSTIQHAARQGDMKPGLPRAPTKSAVVPKANEESHSDVPEPSALPPTASWANKASPPVQNSKLSRPTTAAGSPLRPAALVNQSTAPHLQSESQSQFLTKSVQSQQPPVPQEQRLSVVNAAPQSKGDKIVIPNPTLSLFENAIKMLSNSSSIKFSFSAQILAKEDMASVQSMPPLFAFVSDKSQNGKMADKQSEAKHDGLRSDSHARQGSRYNFSEKLNNSEHLLEQQQMMQGGSVLGIHSGSTPPPGLFGNGQVRDGQDLISQLVSGGRLKVSLPNVEASVADESLRAPQPQRQDQTQGSGPIPSQPEWAFRKLSDESFPPMSEVYSNTNQNPGSARREKPTSPSSVISNSFAFPAAVGTVVDDAIGPRWPIQHPGLGSLSGSSAFAVGGEAAAPPSQAIERRPSSASADSLPVHPAGIRVSRAPSIQTQHLPSTPCPPELSRVDNEATIALSTGPITLSLENPKYSMSLKQESTLTAKTEVNRSEAIDFADKPIINLKTSETYMQQEATPRLASATLMQIPRNESPPQVPWQSASPAPSAASQEAVKGQKKEKKAKKAKKGTTVSVAAATGGLSDSVDDTRSQSETDSAVASSISQQKKPVLDPLGLTKMVVEELEGSNSLTFFKQAITGSVSSPHFTFSQIELEHAEKTLADEITSEMLGGKMLEQLEKEWHASKKDCETLEKKLLKLIKRNRKLVYEV
ncbi:hypothetical protein V1505DRAFT_366978 [Lipomyces doorenjongii]